MESWRSRKVAKKQKLGKGKKIAIIAGCAAAAEALAGVGLTIAAPFTGGATAPLAAAMYAKAASDTGKLIAVGAGALIIGGSAGAVITKKIDSDKETDAYSNGYTDASKAFEAKFAEQAKKFAEKAAGWEKSKEAWEKAKKEKDTLLQDCLKYIADLEKERDSLKAENKVLTQEKQELLQKLYGFRQKLSEL